MHTTTSSRTRALAAGALTITLALGLAACGGDGDDAATATPAKAATARTAAVPKAVCDAAVAFGTAFGQAPQDPAAIQGYAKDTIAPIVARLSTSATGDVARAATQLKGLFDKVAESGDPSAIGGPDFEKATATIGAAVHDGCDFQSVDVMAMEYAYSGVPASLKAGAVSFELMNHGKEDHEMLVLRRKDDVTDSLDDILALPQDQAFSKVDFAGVTFGGPGSNTYVALDLRPGHYFLICSVPVGGGENGAPHFTKGMQAEFTVS